jgi:hypothetical protein
MRRTLKKRWVDFIWSPNRQPAAIFKGIGIESSIQQLSAD